MENHGTVNLQPSTFAGYKSNINNHIIPNIGHIQLRHLTAAMLDNMFQIISIFVIIFDMKILSLCKKAACFKANNFFK